MGAAIALYGLIAKRRAWSLWSPMLFDSRRFTLRWSGLLLIRPIWTLLRYQRWAERFLNLRIVLFVIVAPIRTIMSLLSLLLVACGRTRVVAVMVLAGLLLTPSFLAAYKRLATRQFTDERARIDAFAEAMAGTFVYQAQDDPWCNTILLSLRTAFQPESAFRLESAFPSISTSTAVAS